MFNELINNIEKDLLKQNISSKVLLDTLSLADEKTRSLPFCQDNLYVPFYYYLGKYVNPVNFMEFDTEAGVYSSCFFKSCKSVKNFFSFQEKTKEYYSSRFALKNIRNNYFRRFNFHYGSINDKFFENEFNKFDWDLVFLNKNINSYDKLLDLFTKIWLKLNVGGFLVVEHVKSNDVIFKCYENFCKINLNLEKHLFKTRYGTAILFKT